jgi:hypothetical protein
MKQRCYYPKATSYPRYGGQGITVCDEWLHSFTTFLKDIGPRPSLRHSIDRIDSSKGYSPENCRWATNFEQSDNKARTLKVLFRGKRLPFREIAKITGIDQGTIVYRWKNKVPLDAPLYVGHTPWNIGKSFVDRSRTCEYCSGPFQYKRKSDRFCGTSCSAKWRVKMHPEKMERTRNPITKLFKQGILHKGGETE